MDDDNDKIHKNSKSKYNALRNIKIFDFIEKCGQNADTQRTTKNPNNYKLAIWDFSLVPGADVEWFCLGYGVLCDDILDSDGNY